MTIVLIIQIDRQIPRQTDRQIDRYTNRQIDRTTDRQMDSLHLQAYEQKILIPRRKFVDVS